MPKILYVELFGEERRPDPEARGGYARVMTPIGKCAVFDEKEFDELIQKTQKKLRELRKLREEAAAHSVVMTEGYLNSYGVPFKVKELVKKLC